MSCNCFDYDCSRVVPCVNEDLLKVQSGTSELTNLCSAISKCVDTEFEAFTNGQETNFNFFAQAVLGVFSGIDGFSESGDFYFTLNDGTYSWTPAASAVITNIEDGIGISVSGLGTVGNPYKPNLITSYVRGLFSASNGLTYSLGATKLGGTLTQSTTIVANSFDFTIDGGNQISISGNATDIKGVSSVTTYGEIFLTGIRTFLQLVDGSDSYALDFDNVSKILTLGTTEDLVIQDGTQFDPSIIGTNRTFLKVANYHHANVGDVLSLTSTSTGQVAWITPTIASGAYTDEQAQDAVGNIVSSTSTIVLTYSDSTPSIVGNVVDNSITFTKTQDIATDKLLGRDTTSTGDIEQLSVGGGLEFTGLGGIQTSALTGDITKIAGGTATTLTDNSVTGTKLRDSIAFSVIGKPDTATGDPVDIAAGVDSVLRRSGSGDLQFGTIVTNNIGSSQVIFSKIQNIATQKLLGRSTSGSGVVEELSTGTGLSITGGALNLLGKTLIGITVFNTSGTWTKPVGCTSVLVYVTGGGGGGGGATSVSAQSAVGAGGGGGATRINYFTAGLGSTETVTIGTGGAKGSSGNSYLGQDGTASAFGSHASAGGGIGGSTLATGTAVGTALAGAAGSPTGISSGIISQAYGTQGDYGIRLSSTVVIPGNGGGSFWGAGGNGGALGCGGNGNTASNGTSSDGYDGSSGLVIVYEYS